MTEAKRLINSYGRLRGRKLRPSRQELIDHRLPQVGIEIPPTGKIDLQQLFPKQKEYWLEIGFGGGEHLAHQAKLHPDVGLMGCEPFINGIARLLAQIEELKNIRIYNHDARVLIDALPEASISRVFILYPDPWPKARHNKRRLISPEFLDTLARIMKPGAELRLATDHADYCRWMLERLLPHPAFHWLAKDCEDWLNPPKDWITTRYEQKRLAGRPTYLNFKRR